MDKLIKLIERHRDKWQKKWTKGTQLRDSNSEHYDPFLHGASVGATKAYNNVLQWIKNPSIMSAEKDLALTWEDIRLIDELMLSVGERNLREGNNPSDEQKYTEIIKLFNAQRKK